MQTLCFYHQGKSMQVSLRTTGKNKTVVSIVLGDSKSCGCSNLFNWAFIETYVLQSIGLAEQLLFHFWTNLKYQTSHLCFLSISLCSVSNCRCLLVICSSWFCRSRMAVSLSPPSFADSSCCNTSSCLVDITDSSLLIADNRS